MVYGADRIVQMPVMQLYDTGLMQSAINNARYMYEKAEKRMDDFYEKYGEFMSPFQKDMDRYSQIINTFRKGIDDLYARGEDPLRTTTGRAKLAALTRSVDPTEFSRMKANAKMGYAYLDDIEKARARNEFNEDYENFLLNQPGGPGAFKDFSSANGAMWTRSAAGRYQDLNQYTSHIFDALKDSFIRKDGPYEYYGITEGDLAKSLTPDTLGGLLNSDLGKFHYQNAIRDLAMLGNLNPSKEQVMQQFRNNVVAANHEKVHEDRRIDEVWKLRQENASRMRAARATADGIRDALTPPAPMGVDTALATQSALQHSTIRSKFINDNMKLNADYNPSRQRFGKLLKSDQEIGRNYMKALEIQNDPNATDAAKQEARVYIKSVRAKKDANFVSWRKGYDKLVSSAENRWNAENTLKGRLGYSGKVHVRDVYNAEKDIYSRLHEVPQTSPLAAQLNQHLDYIQDSDGNNYSYMNKNKMLDVVALSKLLGGNYTDSGGGELIKKIAKLLKGKQYYENSNALNRTFGSGTYDGRTINTAREVVTFKDKDVKDFFDGLSSNERNALNYIGIIRNDDGSWNVPITTAIDQGFSWAYEDAMTDKEVGGASYAANNWLDKQAAQWTGIQLFH